MYLKLVKGDAWGMMVFDVFLSLLYGNGGVCTGWPACLLYFNKGNGQ